MLSDRFVLLNLCYNYLMSIEMITSENFPENKKRYRAELKPREIWYKEKPIETDSIFDKFKRAARVISREGAIASSERQATLSEFEMIIRKKNVLEFSYKKGSGIEGMAAHHTARSLWPDSFGI